MVDEIHLPRFRKPPVVEVAIGVQFPDVLNPVHLGLYYQKIKARFPKMQVVPPLPAMFETFPLSAADPAPVAPVFFDTSRPRMWFTSQDDNLLLQIQSDKLIFNWRSGAQGSPYPHFDAIQPEFAQAYDALDILAKAEKIEITPNQCELVYVNSILTANTGVPLSEPQKIFSLWSDTRGPEWQEPLEDLSFNTRYQFTDESGNPFGRLSASLAAGWAAKEASPAYQLQMIARGQPRDPSYTGVAAFHDHAHKAIVRCFAAITTPEMHKLWERYQ
jgi:uncharacterized protein (TIGR04255 family)